MDELFNEIQVPTDFSTLTDDDLKSLEQQANTAGKPLAEKATADAEMTDAEVAGLEKLANVLTGVKAERKRRIGEASVRSGQRAAAKAHADAFSSTESDEDDENEDKAEKEKAATAGARKAPRIADVAKAGGKVEGNPNAQDDESRADGYSSRMVAASPTHGVLPGTEFKTVLDAAKAAEQLMALHPRTPSGQQFSKAPVLYLERSFSDEFKIGPKTTHDQALAIMDHAADQNREGVALTAAAGWCAPSQIDYGLMEIETTAGMLDLPEVNVSRGGLQFTTGPDFAAIFGGSGFFHQTEAQVIAATTKPCMVIPCPTFTEKRLEVEGVCVTGAFLQDRGYPEMVARFIRGVLTAHAHKMNIFKINQLVAGSTLFDYTNTTNLPVTTPEYKDLTVLSRLLAFVGIQIMDMRYKYRMSEDAMLEAVMPYWVVEQVRQDVQRRAGLDPDQAFRVAVEQIRTWFAVRGARVQFVYDWLDTYNATNTSTVGQTAGVYTLPTSVDVLLYPAGTWVAGVADVVRLDTVYDSTNLALNQYTQLFSEEGIMVMKRGYESRRIRAAIQPSGTTSATSDMRTG